MGVLAKLGLLRDDDDEDFVDDDNTAARLCPGHIFAPIKRFSGAYWKCTVCGYTEEETTLRRGSSGGSRVVDGASLRIRT